MRTDGKTERIRCEASYRPLGSSEHEIDLSLKCDSDTYKFNLGGRFRADEGNHVSGQWTEHTRNVGGIVVGNVNGAAFNCTSRATPSPPTWPSSPRSRGSRCRSTRKAAARS